MLDNPETTDGQRPERKRACRKIERKMWAGCDNCVHGGETIALAGSGEVAFAGKVQSVDRRTPQLALCAAVSCAAISGCGGPSATTQVRDLVNSYITDFAAHKGDAACGRLTQVAQKKIQAGAGILRGKDCGATLTMVSNLPTGEQARQVAKLHAGKVVIDGNEAGVIIEPAGPGAKPTRVVKIDGKWLIDGSVGTSR